MIRINITKKIVFSLDFWRNTFVLIPTIGIFTGNLTYKWSIEVYLFSLQFGIGLLRH